MSTVDKFISLMRNTGRLVLNQKDNLNKNTLEEEYIAITGEPDDAGDHYGEIDESTIVPMECMVKWFNPIKGFGFVMPPECNEDIFLHFSVLDTAGFQFLAPGDEISCMVGKSTKGRQVAKIIEVRPSRQSPGQYQNFNFRPLQPVGPLEQIEGEVKWFNAIRGFGFVNPDNGGRDIFVHNSLLRRVGLQKIYPGQRVRMQITNSDRGRQAWTLELA